MKKSESDETTSDYGVVVAKESTASMVYEYEGHPISFLAGDGVYVNATQMSKAFSKLPGDWMRLKATEAYMDALSSDMGIPISQLVIVSKGNSSSFEQGTWLHEDAALEFARWLSPKFAIWCNRVVKKLLTDDKMGIQSSMPRMNPAYAANPEFQKAQVCLYLADEMRVRLRLNDASMLGIYQSIVEPYGIQLPAYVKSEGVAKSVKDLLKEIGSPYSAIKFNQMLESHGYIETKTRPSSGGAVKRFKSVTDKGRAFGENMQNPKNQKETQPLWYADRFRELYAAATR